MTQAAHDKETTKQTNSEHLTAKRIAANIAQELKIKAPQVNAAIELLNEGATVPFIARYRKEKTGALDDQELRLLAERLGYLRELEDRKVSILKSIDAQGKLSAQLKADIAETLSKTQLEDLYLPYKKKRRVKAQIAREAGLEPLAEALLKAPEQKPEVLAKDYINPDLEITDAAAALEGAQHILIERLSEHAPLLESLRQWLWKNGQVQAKATTAKKSDHSKFKDYYDYNESIQKIPSHRALALLRGLAEDELKLSFKLDDSLANHPEDMIRRSFNIRQQQSWLNQTIELCWKKKLLPHLQKELMKKLREAAELEAIHVFSRNLKDLLLAAPAGNQVTLGLDPGYRTGVKAAVVDATGKLLDFATIYPHAPQKRWTESLATLQTLAKRHQVSLISIGNGTASRETEQLAKDLIASSPELSLTSLVVSEAGASVYSASELASKEFPDIDVTIRGAVSIARRLQDPLSELVKIDPKAIGVGQYQHDVDQKALGQSLDNVVEDCVNHVGVDLNTASVSLLKQVAGLNETTAENIVAFRDEQGAFNSRKQLLKVPRLGNKAFEQCAGFLRIRNGKQPLDNSAVHPEAYPLVDKIAASLNQPVSQLVGNTEQLQQLDYRAFVSDDFGEYTVRDVLQELDKPGRDPRPEFKTATFTAGIEAIGDLQVGMQLEGVITNVTNFGAFVDVGVHQDGLVHISQLADRFVKDPHSLVKTGDIVSVRVTEVDEQRKRIGLSMKADTPTQQNKPARSSADSERAQTKIQNRPTTKAATSANLSDSFKAAGFKIK